MLCHSLTDRLQPWLRDYDRLQSSALILIYIQIGCSLIGSLGALYTGVLLINLAISLFALVAIESSSQSLGRTYAVLLLSSLLLDISWFFLFSHDIWNISSDKYGTFFIFSVKLTLSMQIIGFSVRLSSSLLWIQIYRLGVSHLDTTIPREADYDVRTSFLSPVTPAAARQSSGSDEVLGGSIYDPAYYSSLFEDGEENRVSVMVQNHPIGGNGSTSISDVSPLKLSMDRSFHSVDGQNHSICGSLSTSADASPLKLSLGRSIDSLQEDNTSSQLLPFRV
ncbi:uncharacterized protein LOC115725697 isoform X1 [Cannabis sativa]|uniref:uncharacterized protein LOC115725697 isoform X1 n=1 Tax=Cannabis sativa TaxID=3483 RepID=UPI0029CA443A|nr:uncharacterized protein LOC115725697 isoform X1 [Cannabis sativa]